MLFKDTTFEPSSPSPHGTEIVCILGERGIAYPVVFLYTDGGVRPSVDVKLTLIAVFRKLNLYLCASRTTPHHSFLQSHGTSDVCPELGYEVSRTS